MKSVDRSGQGLLLEAAVFLGFAPSSSHRGQKTNGASSSFRQLAFAVELFFPSPPYTQSPHLEQTSCNLRLLAQKHLKKEHLNVLVPLKQTNKQTLPKVITKL